jgi:hypothetical protein
MSQSRVSRVPKIVDAAKSLHSGRFVQLCFALLKPDTGVVPLKSDRDRGRDRRAIIRRCIRDRTTMQGRPAASAAGGGLWGKQVSMAPLRCAKATVYRDS